MQELRLAAVSEDGTYLVLASAGRGTRFMLPVDDRLRAAVRGQFSRLGQYEIEVENPLRPKEIQARIRQGETAEAISEISGIPIERVRWFESPVLQEREYIAQQAQRATVRQQGETAPGPALGDMVAERIGNHQLETGDAVWDSWKREDNTWQLKLVFLVAGEDRIAHWVYEPRRRSVIPADEEAVRFLTPGADDPVDLGPGSANVTPFVPRRPGPAPEPARPEPLRTEPLRTEPARPEPARPDTPLPSAPQRSEEPSAPAASSAPPPAPPSAPPAPPARSDGPGSGRTRITAGRAAPPAESAPGPPAPQRPEAEEPEQSTRGQAPPRQDPPAPEPRETPAPAASTEAPQRAERPAVGRTSVQSAEPPAAPGQAAKPDRGTEQTEHQDGPAARRQEPPVSAAAAGTSGPSEGSGGSAARRKGRGRRASVPSWDEIMFGSKKSD